ncbi:MAG: flippase [Candidatus Bathyarchaeia archaeon]
MLFIGNVLSNLVAAVGSIVVARLLGSINYGIVGIALVPITFIGLFSNWGISSAMIRFLAQYRSQEREEETKGILLAGMFTMCLIGILLFLTALIAAPFLATNIFHRPELTPLIKIASLTLLTSQMILSSQTTFIGFERMEFYSLTMFLQSLTKTLLAPFLVWLGYEALGAMLGHTLSLLLTSIFAIFAVYFSIWRSLRRSSVSLNFFGNLKTMLRYGYPLFISTLLSGALSQIYNFLMALYCSESMIGNYLAASNFTVLITFLTMPISTVLFPAFSKLDHQREKGALKIVFQNSVKYTALVTLPVVAALILLSKPLVHLLYGEGYQLAPLFLVLYALTFIFVGLGGYSLGNLLNSQGKTKAVMALNATRLFTGVPLSLYLIPRFQIVGLLVTMIVTTVPAIAAGIWWVKKDFDFSIEFNSSAKIYAATVASTLPTFFLLKWLAMGDLITFLLGGFLLLFLYIISISLTGALEKKDIQNLRGIATELGPFSHLFNFLLSLVEKIMIRLSKYQP